MFNDFSLSLLLLVGGGAAMIILLVGLRMTALADRIADRTGFGEAVVGGVLLGAATSFSGTIVSLTAALGGRASLAFSNSIGGIAAQTAFLAIADIVYRRANLEHAAAEIANVFQCGVLLALLAIPFAASTAPEVAFWGIHPASFLLVVVYAYGVGATARLRKKPMWRPVDTDETRADEPEEGDTTDNPARWLLMWFLLLMVVLGLAGWIISQIGNQFVDRLGLSASLVGALVTAVITSLPELVTTVAAVRRGALQLAVGGIIGGNTFDILFLTISDAGYRSGSIYHAVGPQDLFWLATGMLMTAVLLLGLEEISRTEENCANIMTIPGIGPMISTAMVAAVGKGEAFDRRRDFAAWVGLVPRQFSTGGRTILGRITKRASRYLRMLFVQAAKVIMMRPHRWSDFSFGPWLTEAVARMPRNKAAIALANKLARTAWSLLRHGTRFDAPKDAAMEAI